MKNTMRQPLLLAALALSVAGSSSAQFNDRTADDSSLPAGTVLKVRLDQRLNSADARPGQRFTATVRSDEDNSGLPSGTQVVGVIRAARPATKQQPGILDVDFTTLELPNGRTYPIVGALNSLDSNSVTRTASGRLVSKQSSQKDRMKFVGYGAGAGALIGLLTKGNLLTNALLGAAGGYLYSQLQKDKAKGGYANVNLKEGAEFGVRLDQRFALLPVSNQRLAPQDRSEPGYTVQDRNADPLRNRRDRLGDRQSAPTGFRGRGAVTVMVDDRAVNFGTTRPMVSGDTLLVPLAPVMRAAGIQYFENPLNREISVNGSRGKVRGTVGSAVAWVGTQRVQLDEPIRNIDGALYVPEQFLELATGMHASWDDGGRTLHLTRAVADRDRIGGF